MQARKGSGRSGTLTLEDFREARGNPVGDERRREPRIPCDRHIDVLPCVADKTWEFKRVGLFDCSPLGLGLVFDTVIAPGEQFIAKLNVGRMALALYTVRHCQTIDARHYKVGAAFAGFVGTEQFDPQAIVKMLIDPANN